MKKTWDAVDQNRLISSVLSLLSSTRGGNPFFVHGGNNLRFYTKPFLTIPRVFPFHVLKWTHKVLWAGGESLQNVIRWILSLFQFCLLFLLNKNSRLLSNSLAQNSVTRGRFNGITAKEKEIHIKSFLHKILVSWSLVISEKSRGWPRNIGNSAS